MTVMVGYPRGEEGAWGFRVTFTPIYKAMQDVVSDFRAVLGAFGRALE
jgi:hypothetical protein